MADGVSRRRFVSAVGAASLAALPRRVLPLGPPSTSQAKSDAESRAQRVLAAFDAQGIHHTGTDIDRASGEWLREEASRAGAEARLVPFELDRLDVRDAAVVVDGRRVDGLPLFDAAPSNTEGIEAMVGPDGIVVSAADRQAIGTEGEFLRDRRRDPRTRAIVVITDGDVLGLVPSNARRFTEPYGCPVVQVSGAARGALDEARRTGQPVRVISYSVRTRTTAFNVVAEVEGGDRSLAPVMVITPRSGWWTCAAERGGGIACWLETIRVAARQRPRRPMRFLASSGHELGHLGLEAFLHANDALIGGAHAWIHLGANIGAGAPGTTPAGVRLQVSHDDLDEVMTAALTSAGAPIADRLPRGQVPAGEARNLHIGGARYVSLLGQGNRWFHHEDDRYPRAVTASLVARYATAAADAALGLARG